VNNAPSSAATHCDASAVSASGPLHGHRVGVVVFSHYPSDPRPRREAEALMRQGASVEVICLQNSETEPCEETFNNVQITRVRLKKRRGGKLTYVAQYAGFIISAFVRLTWRSLDRRFSLVHIHNMPDVLVFSALVPKLLGAKVILDLHDPMPELMMSIYGLREGSRAVGLLKFLEKISLWFADAVLTVNLACKRIFISRSCDACKLQVVMNSPDEGIFQFVPAAAAPRASTGKPFVLMYHGSIVERHGLDLAVVALEKILQQVPHAVLRIYGGSTPFLQQVMEDVKARGLGHAVQHFGPKNLNQIVAAIDECDVGVIPNRRSIFTEINTPTRIFEYLSRGKAVIAPRAPGITDYFSEASLLLFELGDADSLAAQMQLAHDRPDLRAETIRGGQAVYQAHRWTQEQIVFLNLANELAGVVDTRVTCDPAAGTAVV
jgi:glycosyltransferase involved in cell wall biosynthesis